MTSSRRPVRASRSAASVAGSAAKVARPPAGATRARARAARCRRVRRRSDAAAPPHAEGEGVQEPVPHRVPRREPDDARHVRRERRGLPGHLARARASSPSGASSRCWPAARCPSPSRSARTGSPRPRSRPSRRPVAASRRFPFRGRPGVPRPEGTPSPTGKYTPVPGFHGGRFPRCKGSPACGTCSGSPTCGTRFSSRSSSSRSFGSGPTSPCRMSTSARSRS